MAEDIIDYMYGLVRFGIKPGLDVIQGVLRAIDDPQLSFKTVHITGTNGKGSTAALLASMLSAASYRVGLYTSPHLARFNERIRVDGREISDKKLAALAGIVKEASAKANLEPTFFEFTTAVAFEHFRREKVDIAIIEVGMGGRLDATNVITPLVSIITNIGFDHMEHLGDTLEKIAAEKAGIIKTGCSLVTTETDPHLCNYFTKVCKERNATYVHVDNVVKVQRLTSNLDGQQFSLTGSMNGTFTLCLLGEHQLRNALAALVAVSELRTKGLTISDDAISNGLANARWPGRIDIVRKKPLLILDGAHNLDGMQTLAIFMADIPSRKVLVIAMKQDKDIDGALALIVPLFENIIVTEGNHKPRPAADLGTAAKRFGKPVIIEPDVSKALDKALSIAGLSDTILVTGSLYMVGDAIIALRAKKLLRDSKTL